MTWRTHAVGALASLWLLAPVPGVITPEMLGPLCAAAALGALLPDLDAARSKLSAWKVYDVEPLAPLARALSRWLGHRGPLHSPAGLAGLGLVCLALSPWLSGPLAAALWLGYASHLALDACTIHGIPAVPGLPARSRPDRRLHLLPAGWRVVTGSSEEGLVFAPLAMLALALLLRALP